MGGDWVGLLYYLLKGSRSLRVGVTSMCRISSEGIFVFSTLNGMEYIL